MNNDEQNIDHMIIKVNHGEAPLKQGIFYRCEYCKMCKNTKMCNVCIADETTYKKDYVWGHDVSNPHFIFKIDGGIGLDDNELIEAIDDLKIKIKNHLLSSPLAKDLNFALNTIIERHNLAEFLEKKDKE